MKINRFPKSTAAALVIAAAMAGAAASAGAADQTTPPAQADQTTPPAMQQMPMMGQSQAPVGPGGMMPGMMRGGPWPMGMMNPQLMQQHWDAMQAHMKVMETHMANIEALLKELVAQGKSK
jgi:hypothetical protein